MWRLRRHRALPTAAALGRPQPPAPWVCSSQACSHAWLTDLPDADCEPLRLRPQGPQHPRPQQPSVMRFPRGAHSDANLPPLLCKTSQPQTLSPTTAQVPSSLLPLLGILCVSRQEPWVLAALGQAFCLKWRPCFLPRPLSLTGRRLSLSLSSSPPPFPPLALRSQLCVASSEHFTSPFPRTSSL